jgi:hypothetical protein
VLCALGIGIWIAGSALPPGRTPFWCAPGRSLSLSGWASLSPPVSPIASLARGGSSRSAGPPRPTSGFLRFEDWARGRRSHEPRRGPASRGLGPVGGDHPRSRPRGARVSCLL